MSLGSVWNLQMLNLRNFLFRYKVETGEGITTLLKMVSFALVLSFVQVISNSPANAADVTLTYDSNVTQHQRGVISSGTVPSPAVYAQNSSVTVSQNSGNLSRQGFIFGGWNTLATGLGTNYNAGSGSFSITANRTLYANWLIPPAARLIGSSGSISTLKNLLGSSTGYSGVCSSGLSGITSDGTFVYFMSALSAGTICKVDLEGEFISSHSVASADGAPALSLTYANNRDLTFSSGCIWLRETGATVNSALYCISVADWTMRPVATPSGRGLLVGSYWLYGNLIDFPDGRIGAVSAASPNRGSFSTNYGGANGNTLITCPADMFCKVLRLYNPSGSGSGVSLTFSEDIVLADTVDDINIGFGATGWPNDDHGIATDGTYLYQIKYNSGYKVWALTRGAPSYLVFNAAGSGTCDAGTTGSLTGTSGRLCLINNPLVGSTGTLSNATFFGRNHVTNQYIMGDYQSNKFYISEGVAPPAGPGSDKSITFTASAAATLKYGSTTSAGYSVNRSLGTESSPSLTGAVLYETVTSTACNVNSSTGLVTMLRAAGTCQIRVKLQSDSFYTDTSSVLVSISPAKADTLTVTASAVGITYNGNAQIIPYSYSISGLKFSDTLTALSYRYTGNPNSGGTTSGTTTVNSAGLYTISPETATISNSDSYTAITYATGTLTVNRATRTITGSAAGSVKYGSEETLTIATVPSSSSDGTLSFAAGSSSACSVVSNSGRVTMNRASGTCSIVPTISQGANYLTATGDAVSITPAKADAIIVTADGKTSTYTGSASSITPTYSVLGLQFQDTVTVTYGYSGSMNNGDLYSFSSTKPTNAGTYSIIPMVTQINSDSYTASATINSGALTISRASRTISPSTYSKSTLKYGESATVTSNVTSPSTNDDGAFSYSVGSGCTIDSGSGAVTAANYLGTCSARTTILQGYNYESATAATTTNFSLSKADTITVTASSPSAVNYTGSVAAITPTVSVSGLVAGNTVSGATYNFSRAPSCALGGTCQVGDTGPGGGKVFYVSGSVINAAPGISSGGIYLEMAPSTFSKTTYNWCEGSGNPYTSLFGATATTIGSGAANTKIMIDNCSGGAGVQAVNLTLGGQSDWFLPSYSELVEIYSQRTMLGLGTGKYAATNVYWSSTEGDAGVASSLVPWAGVGGQNKAQATPYLPIRAFSPTSTTYGSPTSTPTNAGLYRITPSALALDGGITTDYYVATVYETGTVTINKVAQSAFTNYSTLSGIFGITFPIFKFGGSGDGAESIETTNGSSTGCALSGTLLTASTAGTCSVSASKDSSENYTQYDAVFSVNFFYYVPAPVAPVSTVPTQIAIAATNSWSANATVGPTITSISPSSGPAGTVVTITGTGLNGVDVIKIGRRVLTSITGVSSTSITGVIPVGASSGPIMVSNSFGGDFSATGFTVTP